MIDRSLIAMCGAYCGDCSYREPLNCPTCQAVKGNPPWGTCQVATCCSAKGLTHCGECTDLPCEILQGAFDVPEHGDRGERLDNLKAWAAGSRDYIPLGSYGPPPGTKEDAPAE